MTFKVDNRYINKGGIMKKDELEKIYKLYYKDLYVYGFSICKNHYLTEELISDSFYKAFISLEDYEGSFKCWLFIVFRNLFIDKYRKNKRIIFKNIEKEDLKINDETLNDLINKFEKERLYKGILKLPNNYKEVIIMFYFMEFSGEEISEILGVSKGAVRTLLYRGRIKLKDILKEDL